MLNFVTRLESGLDSKRLLPSTVKNLTRVYENADTPAYAKASLNELISAEAWTELNDRFYQNLAFGTGGMRGRSMGKIITIAEHGHPQALDRPEFPAVGTNVMNFTNLTYAAQGLGAYLLKTFPSHNLKVVISHDTRHFSRDFAETCARALAAMGITPYLFPDERSTPQLSFTVRWLKAHAGIMITASHNPPYDNGFKAYFNDGGQLVEPHASAIITEVLHLAEGGPVPQATQPATLQILDASADEAYLEATAQLVLEPTAIAAAKDSLKIVYTPIHGTGVKMVPALLQRFGFKFSIVPSQEKGDGRFPTVKSPNPENAEALTLAMVQAKVEGADLVMATDPDCDRMGVAVKNQQGELELLTGNQIGSIMAYYRTERFFAQGVLDDRNKARAAIIKTYVTTDLQKKIAEHFGVKCVETLTGFKYIGEKLRDYEAQCGLTDYDAQTLTARRQAQLGSGTFFIFGGEESYGYSGADYVRDKDGNAAVLMFAEVAAYAKTQGQTLLDYLDHLYQRFGYFTEKLGTLTFEGAAGAAQIKQLLHSYRGAAPKEMTGQAVVQIQDFDEQEYQDIDGKRIPKETLLIFHLADGSRMAVRASGTEPKIKFYFFTQAPAADDLNKIKAERKDFLSHWWSDVQKDVALRIKTT